MRLRRGFTEGQKAEAARRPRRERRRIVGGDVRSMLQPAALSSVRSRVRSCGRPLGASAYHLPRALHWTQKMTASFVIVIT